ncbi:MAG: cytochrome c oxidase assembly protein [Acidimicrobiales bacterium]
MSPGVGIPGFSPHAEVLVVLLAAGVGYWWATTRLAPASRRQRAWFTSGLLLVWAGSSWPVHDIAEDQLYVVHMVQHVVFTFIAPPMLLLGTPTRLVGWLVRPALVGAVARMCTRPLVALIGFNLIVGLSHVRSVVDGATTSAPLHFGVHLVLFASALCLWSPVVNRAPELPRMRSTGKMLYLMANGFLPVPIVAALALASSPIYHHYASAPRLWGLSAVEDQQLAAGAMWMLESFWTIGAVMIVFFDWWRTEQRDPATASLPEHIRHRSPATVQG